MGCSGYAQVLDLKKFKDNYNRQELIDNDESGAITHGWLPEDISDWSYHKIADYFLNYFTEFDYVLFNEHYVLTGNASDSFRNDRECLIVSYANCDIANIEIN